MKLFSVVVGLATAQDLVPFTCGPILKYTSLDGTHEALNGRWTLVLDGNNNYNINDDYPYYRHDDGETYMWWMWHGDIGHWVVNKNVGTHGGDIIKTTFQGFACPQDNPTWNEFDMGNKGNFLFEADACCDKFIWQQDDSAQMSGTWTKNGNFQDNWPVFQKGDLFMWWMWHGALGGHWVVNTSPGEHQTPDVSKTVGWADMACPTEFTEWNTGNNFNVACEDRVEEFCNANPAPTFKMSAKWNKVHRAGAGAWGVRVNAPGVPEETPYTGFLAFAKKDCGNPFISALLDGTVSLYAMDLEASYKIQYQYYGGISKHENIVIQFNHTPCSSTKCVGTKKRDQAELYIVGTEQVEWGKKSEGDCIASMRNGFLGANANNAEVIDRDITPCVSMANKYWN